MRKDRFAAPLGSPGAGFRGYRGGMYLLLLMVTFVVGFGGPSRAFGSPSQRNRAQFQPANDTFSTLLWLSEAYWIAPVVHSVRLILSFKHAI